MKNPYYKKMYEKIFKTMDKLTPLKVDCGQLCSGACCKGDSCTGMLLFPGEDSPLTIINGEHGERLAVCNGTCDRQSRPLSCRIFPFFPTISENGKIFVEPDLRAARLCPLIEHSDEIEFDPKFFKAVKKIGKILAKDDACRSFLKDVTTEIDEIGTFIG